jgi:hypothetical protein
VVPIFAADHPTDARTVAKSGHAMMTLLVDDNGGALDRGSADALSSFEDP